MKQGLLVILLHVSLLTFSQKADVIKNATADVPKFTFLEKVGVQTLVGQLHISFGYCGTSYWLGPDFMFKETFGCCLGDTVVQTGTWGLMDDQILLVNGTKGLQKFYIVSMHRWLYFVRDSEKNDFIKTVQSLTKKYKRRVKREGENSANYFLHYSIDSRFFSKESSNKGT
jgi:hypothetical protein